MLVGVDERPRSTAGGPGLVRKPSDPNARPNCGPPAQRLGGVTASSEPLGTAAKVLTRVRRIFATRVTSERPNPQVGRLMQYVTYRSDVATS